MNNESICPNCLSALQVTSDGTIECQYCGKSIDENYNGSISILEKVVNTVYAEKDMQLLQKDNR